LKDYLLKDAAKILGINYSTAKTILRVFRIEKRIKKKNAEREKEIRSMIRNLKEDEIHGKEASISSNTRKSDTTQSGNERKVYTKVDDICCSMENLTSLVNKCFENVKVNQQMINNLMIMTLRLDEQFRRGTLNEI
jgi:hypothetical protein